MERAAIRKGVLLFTSLLLSGLAWAGPVGPPAGSSLSPDDVILNKSTAQPNKQFNIPRASISTMTVVTLNAQVVKIGGVNVSTSITSGTSVYPATAAASFPLGFTAGTGSFTGTVTGTSVTITGLLSGQVIHGSSAVITGTVSGSNLSGTNTGDVTIGTPNGLSVSGQALSMTAASSVSTGSLRATDFSTFNNKLSTNGNGSSLTGLTKTQVGLSNVQNVDQTDASNLASGQVDPTLLGTGTPTSGKYVRGDGAWTILNSTAAGLGQVTNDAQVKKTDYTQKGGFLVGIGTGGVYANQAPGTNGFVLIANSLSPTGLSYILPPNSYTIYPATSTGVFPFGARLSTVTVTGTTIFQGLVNGTTVYFSSGSFSGPLNASNLSGTNTGDVSTGTANGLILQGQVISMSTASAAQVGALTAADWSRFNTATSTNAVSFSNVTITTATVTNITIATGTATGFNLVTGTLGSTVIASSIAVHAVIPASIAAGSLNPSVIVSSYAVASIVPSAVSANTYSNITLPAANVASGSLGSAVIASSVAVAAVQDASIVAVSASKLTGTGTLPNAVVDKSSITAAGNAFNGNSQLVQTTSGGAFPALSGTSISGIPQFTSTSSWSAGQSFSSATITNLSVNNLVGGNVAVTTSTNSWSAAQTFSSATITSLSVSNLTGANVAETTSTNSWSAQQTFSSATVTIMTGANLWTNVKTFGAKGDGTTDDTTAIQNAFNSVRSSGTLLIPPGQYVFSSPIIWPNKDSVTVIGYGAVLRLASGSNSDLMRNFSYPSTGGGQNPTLIGLTMDGNSANNPASGSVVFNGINNGQMTNVTVQNVFGVAFFVLNASSWTFESCRALNASASGFCAYNGSHNIYWNNCTAFHCAPGFLLEGLEVDGQSKSTELHINGGSASAATIGQSGVQVLDGVEGFSISNMEIRNNTGRGIDVYSATTTALSSTQVFQNLNGVIANNVIMNNQASEGIKIWDGGNGLNSGANNIVVTGNRVGAATPGTQANGIVLQSSANYITVANNNVVGNTTPVTVGSGTNVNGMVFGNLGHTASQTGTGAMVLAAAPTFTAGITLAGALTGATTIDGSGAITSNGQIQLSNNNINAQSTGSASTYTSKRTSNGDGIQLNTQNGSGADTQRVVVQSGVNIADIDIQNSTMTIATGWLGIGRTSAQLTAQLHTNSTVRFQAFGAGAATFDANGNVSSASDERLKTIDGSFTKSLASLQGVQPILYHWNKKSGLDMVNQYAGFSAQNVNKTIPEAAPLGTNGFYSLEDRALLAVAINAINELSGEVEALKKEIKDLKK